MMPTFNAGSWRATLSAHWTLYLMEAAGLGAFMVSACMFVALLEHPDSVLRQAMDSDLLRRAVIAIAMGLTAIGIIYSPWGKRSGAHLNPAVTLTFWRLGKIDGKDALCYVLAQFAGALTGVGLCALLLPGGVMDAPSVNYAATLPGLYGVPVALLAETVISFGMMYMVLLVSNKPALNRLTGLFAGMLVALYILLEAPLSGMSMNPARTVGSALPASVFDGLWLYFIGPLAGMLVAAQVYALTHGQRAVLCCKLHHDNEHPCIFRCAYPHD